MSNHVMLLSIIVSIVSGLSAFIGGWTLVPFITYYQDYISIKYGQEIDPAVVRRGYFTAGIALIAGLFFFYRVYFILTNHADFQSSDWLLYDLMTGISMFMSTHFLVSIYRERRRIEKIVADRNDELLSETF